MAAIALSEELARRRKVSAAKKPSPLPNTPAIEGCCNGDDIGMYGDRNYGRGRHKSDMPAGMGDVYPMWDGVDDTRPWTKLFLRRIQDNKKVGRLPRDMYDQLWHFFNGHYAHYDKARVMAMWKQVAAFYKLLKDRNVYPGWNYTYDFDIWLRQDMAPFQETVIEMFKELARTQIGIDTSKPVPTKAATLDPVPELRLDPIGPSMSNVPGHGRMAGLQSVASLGKAIQDCCDTDEPFSNDDHLHMPSKGIKFDPEETMSSEEHHICTWFRESNADALQAYAPELGSEPGIKWVDGKTSGPNVHTTLMTHARMRRVGIVYKDGSLPPGPDPMPLYWIQAKPDEMKEHFGAWDPVNARWRMHQNRTVVPIERRYAPVECGYGTEPEKELSEQVCKSHGYFTDYEDLDLYDNTGLAPGVEYIQMQAEQLPMGSMLGTEHGWGASTSGDVVYYTPQLRHVEIDRSVAVAAGKQFVYGWYGLNEPVVPNPCSAFSPAGEYDGQQPNGYWNTTNSCWMFPLDADGNFEPASICVGDTERERDGDMRDDLMLS